MTGGGGVAGKRVKRRWRVKRVPKAPALKENRVDWKMYRMRAGTGGWRRKNGPYEHRVWRGDMSEKWRCEHGRQKCRCRDCGGVSFCHHDRRRSVCKVCAFLPPTNCAPPRLRSTLAVRRTVAAAASACTSGSAPGARSAAARRSACTSGSAPTARSAGARRSAFTDASVTTAGTAGARASASTASGATPAPASMAASPWASTNLRPTPHSAPPAWYYNFSRDGRQAPREEAASVPWAYTRRMGGMAIEAGRRRGDVYHPPVLRREPRQAAGRRSECARGGRGGGRGGGAGGDGGRGQGREKGEAAMAGEAGAQGPRPQGEPGGLENVPHAGRQGGQRPVRVPRVAGVHGVEQMALQARPDQEPVP